MKIVEKIGYQWMEAVKQDSNENNTTQNSPENQTWKLESNPGTWDFNFRFLGSSLGDSHEGKDEFEVEENYLNPR